MPRPLSFAPRKPRLELTRALATRSRCHITCQPLSLRTSPPFIGCLFHPMLLDPLSIFYPLCWCLLITHSLLFHVSILLSRSTQPLAIAASLAILSPNAYTASLSLFISFILSLPRCPISWCILMCFPTGVRVFISLFANCTFAESGSGRQ